MYFDKKTGKFIATLSDFNPVFNKIIGYSYKDTDSFSFIEESTGDLLKAIQNQDGEMLLELLTLAKKLNDFLRKREENSC